MIPAVTIISNNNFDMGKTGSVDEQKIALTNEKRKEKIYICSSILPFKLFFFIAFSFLSFGPSTYIKIYIYINVCNILIIAMMS